MMQKSTKWEEISGKDRKYRIGMLVYIGLYIIGTRDIYHVYP